MSSVQVLHREQQAFLGRFPGRSGKAITLIATVLLSVLAATIALVIVRQTGLVVSADSSSVNDIVVSRSAEDAKREFERQLAENPQFYLQRTADNERPRRCLGDPNVGWVLAGQQWPSSCGTTWTYPEAFTPGTTTLPAITDTVQNYDPSAMNTRIEIAPPSPTSPYLTLTVLSAGGSRESGLRTTYTQDPASRWTVYSPQAVNLSELTGPRGFGGGGRVYSNSTVTVPAAASDYQAQLLASETRVEINGTTSAQIAEPNPTGSALNIRDVVSHPLEMSQLQNGAQQARNAACGLGAENTAVGNYQQGTDTYALSVCAQQGGNLTDLSGAAVPVPADARAYLVSMNSSTQTSEEGILVSPTLDIYYTTESLSFPTRCETTCDVTSIGFNLTGSGTYPGDAPGAFNSPWRKLTTTYLPASGVAFFDTDTFVSQPELPARMDRNLTLVAGTSDASANIYLTGSITAERGALLGLVSTGGTYIPSYATSSGRSITIDASIAALTTPQTQAAFSTLPARGVTESSAQGSITINGSVAADTLGSFSAVSSTRINNPGSLTVVSAPAFPSFSVGWFPAQTIPLTSLDLCGDAIADSVNTTCVQSW